MINTQLIAEIGQAHDGSNGILHSYIDAVSNTGVTHIKFQMHYAEAESSEFEKFRVKFSRIDKTRHDYWKRMELTLTEWKDVYLHCESVGLKFLCTPFSMKAVDVLEQLGVESYKIGSGDVNNFALLRYISSTKKHIILSSGMSNYEELDASINLISSLGCQFSILQCTTEYPTKPSTIGLNVIGELKQRYNCKVGLSDHSGTTYPSFAAAALGAEIFEVHTCFHKKIFGPDTVASITVDQLTDWTQGILNIIEMVSNPVDKKNIDDKSDLRQMFGRSLAVNKQLLAGHVVRITDLETKKPFGYGLPSANIEDILGRTLRVDKNQWEFLKEEDFL